MKNIGGRTGAPCILLVREKSVQQLARVWVFSDPSKLYSLARRSVGTLPRLKTLKGFVQDWKLCESCTGCDCPGKKTTEGFAQE